MQGDKAGAVEDYAMAIRIDPQYLVPHYNMALAKGETPPITLVDAVSKMDPMNDHYARELHKLKSIMMASGAGGPPGARH